MGKLLEDREFRAGSTGWTVRDLDDPQIRRLWDSHHFEIVEGVLAEMPPAALDGSIPLNRLSRLISRHLDKADIDHDWGHEIDLIVSDDRLSRPDAMLVFPSDLKDQAKANARHPQKQRVKYGALRIAPRLVIESVSLGHEQHDRALKRRWYSEFRVENYWILDAFRQTLECLVLEGRSYKLDVMGRKAEKIQPKAFPGLSIPLKKLWI
jgi:Uma2 family endonuclease